MTTQNPHPDASGQDTIKAAAKRMCATLEAKGHKIAHTAMLEALAQGFGLDNWRTLKAVIDAPRAPATAPAKPVVPELGQWQTWSVSGIYTDNNQQYGDNFEGRTPLEGAVNALMDRWTDFHNEIHICGVEDASGKSRLSPNFITEIALVHNDKALRTLARQAVAVHAAQHPQQPYGPELAWLLAELGGVLEEPAPRSMFDPVTDVFEHLTDYVGLDESRHPASEHPARIGDQPDSKTPRQALEYLLDLVEQHHGGVVKLEAAYEELATRLYQVRAMCTYFGKVVDDPDLGFAEVFIEE
jgi:hypothetical protein